MKSKQGKQVIRWPRRPGSTGNHHVSLFEPALCVAFMFVLASPMAKDPGNIATIRAKRAQEIVDEMRGALPISNPVQIAVVVYQPLVFSVQPTDSHKDRFLLTMELGFLLMLKDDELRAALAHELGHVWIYTHYPFLQTERLANVIGQRIADRTSFEKVYSKLWGYEGASGVPLDDLLGPSSAGLSPTSRTENGTRP